MIKREIISGIYKWINKINLKYYVGSSKDILGFSSNGRKYQHYYLLTNNEHPNNHLQRAWNKYGENNFTFIIIENDIPESQLLIVEQKYLDIAKLEKEKCYNQSFIAGRVEMTQKIRNKISKTRIDKGLNEEMSKRMTGKDNPNYGQGEKIIGEKNPFYNKKHSQKSKLKMSEKRSGKNNYGYDWTIYKFYNLETNEYFVGTRHEFYTKYNLNRGDICYLVKNKRKSINNWVLDKNI